MGKCLKILKGQQREKLLHWDQVFIIKEDGIVITNNHVISGADNILVRVGEKEYKAKVIGADPYMDIAVLKMNTSDKFRPVKFGDSDKARVGDWAVAIGNPFGLGWNCNCRNYFCKKQRY